MDPALPFLIVGYPLAIAMLTRWLPIVRQQRTRWFLAHEAGVASIVTGWLIRGRTQGVVVNGSWLVVAAAWYILAGRRRSRPTP